MLSTLGFVFLLIGIVLVVLGYTVEGRALRPGWGCVILAIVLILLGYLLPSLTTSEYQHARAVAGYSLAA